MTTFLHAELLDERFPNHCKFDWHENALVLDLEWTRRGETLFLRPRDAPLEMLWSCGTNRIPPDDSLIIENLEWAFRGGITRCHCFGDTLIFINRNQGVVPHPKGFTPNIYQWPFGASFMLPKDLFPKFQKPQISLLSPPALVETALTQLAQEEQSDFNLARRWIENYRDSWSNIEFTMLGREEVEYLLQALWFIYAAENLPHFYIPVLRNGPQDKVVAFISTAQWHIPERLIEVFNANSGLKSVKRGCFYAYGKWCRDTSVRVYSIDVSSPSDQQRIAAIHRWLEFLCDKLAPDEISLLLPSM